jgi:hypothetical protein
VISNNNNNTNIGNINAISVIIGNRSTPYHHVAYECRPAAPTSALRIKAKVDSNCRTCCRRKFDVIEHSDLTKVCLLNARSIGNKSAAINDLVASSRPHRFGVVESWRQHQTYRREQRRQRKDSTSSIHQQSALVSVKVSKVVPTTTYSFKPNLPPSLYVFNAAALCKPHAIEQLTVELSGYDIDVAMISETHLKQKHSDSCVSIEGYSLFLCDRQRRRGGGVAIYIRRHWQAVEWSIPGDTAELELLCR